ncbi:MAG: hypothetical protein ACYTET_05645, partial [Planctomycetota bacterium]
DARVAELSAEAITLLAEGRQTNKELRTLLDTNSSENEDELANIAQLVDQMNTTLERFDQLIRMRSPEITVIMQNFRRISDDMSVLVETLKKNPSELIFSKPPEKKETSK